jgi:hypothetical protein
VVSFVTALIVKKGTVYSFYNFGRHFSCHKRDEVHITTGHEDPDEGYRYSSTFSLTLALEGHATAASHLLYRMLDGLQRRSGQVRKISP